MVLARILRTLRKYVSRYVFTHTIHIWDSYIIAVNNIKKVIYVNCILRSEIERCNS